MEWGARHGPSARPPAVVRPPRAALSLRTWRSRRTAPSRARRCSCDVAGREETGQGLSCDPHIYTWGANPPALALIWRWGRLLRA